MRDALTRQATHTQHSYHCGICFSTFQKVDMRHHIKRNVKHVVSKSSQPPVLARPVLAGEVDSQSFPFAYTNGVRHYLCGLGVQITTRLRRKVPSSTVAA